jgi:hypothetical protein
MLVQPVLPAVQADPATQKTRWLARLSVMHRRAVENPYEDIEVGLGDVRQRIRCGKFYKTLFVLDAPPTELRWVVAMWHHNHRKLGNDRRGVGQFQAAVRRKMSDRAVRTLEGVGNRAATHESFDNDRLMVLVVRSFTQEETRLFRLPL